MEEDGGREGKEYTNGWILNGFVGERLVAGPGTTGLGRTKPEKTTWSHLPVGSPPAGRVIVVGCIAYRAVGKSGVLGVRIPSSADVERYLTGGEGA